MTPHIYLLLVASALFSVLALEVSLLISWQLFLQISCLFQGLKIWGIKCRLRFICKQ